MGFAYQNYMNATLGRWVTELKAKQSNWQTARDYISATESALNQVYGTRGKALEAGKDLAEKMASAKSTAERIKERLAEADHCGVTPDVDFAALAQEVDEIGYSATIWVSTARQSG